MDFEGHFENLDFGLWLQKQISTMPKSFTSRCTNYCICVQSDAEKVLNQSAKWRIPVQSKAHSYDQRILEMKIFNSFTFLWYTSRTLSALGSKVCFFGECLETIRCSCYVLSRNVNTVVRKWGTEHIYRHELSNMKLEFQATTMYRNMCCVVLSNLYSKNNFAWREPQAICYWIAQT